jgi:hypothetical protein
MKLLKSPDMSLIENVWSCVDSHLRCGYDWHDKKTFRQAVVMAWEAVTSYGQYRENLFKSMPNRLQVCIDTGGEVVR